MTLSIRAGSEHGRRVPGKGTRTGRPPARRKVVPVSNQRPPRSKQHQPGSSRAWGRRSVGRPRILLRALGRVRDDSGMTTAEYAVGTVAACGFAGLLLKIVTSAEVATMLKDVIKRAFSLVF